MITEIYKIDSINPLNDISAIEKAAGVILKGGLVAFPTETVYGLGANALDKEAVKKIYEAKGRPSDNPLIVHISSKDELDNIVSCVSPKAQELIDNFWPGALTLVMPKKNIIPFETSGGLSTVAVRCPENKIARLLIKAAKTPIAAPSANISSKPSPTRASHVEFDLKGKIDMILDGGGTEFGLESTIMDMTGETPRLLRPGSVTKEMIENVIGEIHVDESLLSPGEKDIKPKAPGMKYKHYSPLAKVFIVDGEINNVIIRINELAKNSEALKVGIMATDQTEKSYDKGIVLSVGDREKPETIGSNLFKVLRKFDYLGVSEIYSESFEDNEIGFAIMNRLVKAAGYNIIKV